MHIVDAIKALKGGLATEKEAHMTTMTEREEARGDLDLSQKSLAISEGRVAEALKRAEKAEAELAAAATELGVEYPAVDPAAPLKGK